MSVFHGWLELPEAIRSLSRKVDTLMSNQETANQLAADIAEDVETIARVSDQLTNVNINLQAQLAEAIAALEAAGVDFSGLQASAASLDTLAKALEATANPTEPTPPVDEIPEVPVVVEPEPEPAPEPDPFDQA